jgi:DNA-directed RNA polymerase specialized sigma24 family protein
MTKDDEVNAMPSPSPPIDPALAVILAASDERDANDRFGDLWNHSLKAALGRTLAGKVLRTDEREDLLSDTMIDLLEILRARREARNSAAPPIANFTAFARRIALRRFYDHCRSHRPRWRRLKQAVLNTLRRPEYAVVKDQNLSYCFLRASGPGGRAPVESDAERDYREFRRDYLASREAREVAGEDLSRLHELVSAFLRWIKTPIAVDALVQEMAILLEIEDLSSQPLDEPEFPEPPDHDRESAHEKVIRQEALKRFGRFLIEGEMTLVERGAVSLNLERDFINDELEVFLTELAGTLGFPAEDPPRFSAFLRKIWNRLALTDDGIAQALEIGPSERTSARTKVAGGRKTALTRKYPAWLKQKGYVDFPPAD